MVGVGPKNSGSVRFMNCAFWGPCSQVAQIQGEGTVGFNGCTFVQWDGLNKRTPAIDALGGTVLVKDCEFREDKLHVRLGKDVKRAIISDNLTPGSFHIENRSAGKSAISNNLGSEKS